MSGAHVTGVRIAYASAPDAVRRWVERSLGGPIVDVVDCVGGLSPGPAARVGAAHGRRAFVKACGPELNPDTPDLLRTEASVLAALPEHPSLPRLLDVHDDGDWVVLLIEDLAGHLPGLPWQRDDLDRVSRAIRDVRGVLDAASVPVTRKASETSALMTRRWRELGPLLDGADPWWRRRYDTLALHAAHAAEAIDGDHLVHWDIRADNVILAEERTVLIDWGQARRAAPWTDHLLLALDCTMSGSVVPLEEFLGTDPSLGEVDHGDVLAVISALALGFKAKALGPPIPSLPTLQATCDRWADSLQPYLETALATFG